MAPITRFRKSANPGRPRARSVGERAGSSREAEVGPHAFASGGQRCGAPLVAEGGDEGKAAADFGVVICGEGGAHYAAWGWDLAPHGGGVAGADGPGWGAR